jgi:hypothetical protein
MNINGNLIWAWIIIFIPAALYLWLFFSYLQVVNNKRNELERILSRGGAMSRYISAYGSADEGPEQVAARLLIRNNYAILSYLRAFGFTALLTTMASVVAVVRAGLPTALPSSLVNLITSAQSVPAILAGCAGAFVWGLYELLRRYRVGDLTPSAVYFTGIRLLVLSGVGPSLSTVLKTEFSWAIAFGVILLNTIADITAEPTRRALKLSPAATAIIDPLFLYVQGLTTEMIDRLSEAGIQNVQQLAFTDPLRLLVRTNLDWKVILDLIDQSFLVVFVGSKIQKLRPIGIRGAVEFSALPQGINPNPLVASIAAILEYQVEEVELLINTFRGDPTTSFIGELWSS